jgi:hypothetical protein
MAKAKNYKKLKKLPAPEVAKPSSHTKKKKVYRLEYRLTKENKMKEISYYEKKLEALRKNDWEPYYHKKYTNKTDAEKVIRKMEREVYGRRWMNEHELRITEIEE